LLDSFTHVVGHAAMQIIRAALTLLPALIAYWLYGIVVASEKTRPVTRLGRTWRIVKHVSVALFVVFVVAYGTGQSCPQDDDGYCVDEDWKPPTPQENLAALARLTILTLGGMAQRAHNYKDKPKLSA
jgi:hypothetical protein